MARAAADDTQLASCGDDGVRVWTAGGAPLPRPARSAATPLAAPFAAVLWYPSGKLLAAGARSGAVALYLQGTLAYLSELRPPGAAPPAVAAIDVSHGSRYLAVGDAAGALSVWDMKNRAVDARFDPPPAAAPAPAAAVSIQRTAESRYVACARGGSVAVYSRVSRRRVSEFAVRGAAVAAVAFSPLHINILAAADDAGGVTVFDITRGAEAETGDEGAAVVAHFPSASGAPATGISFCEAANDAYAFAVSALDKTVRLFSLSSGACRMRYSFDCPAPLTAVAVAADHNRLAAGTSTGTIAVYQLACRPDADFYSHSLVIEIERAHVLPKDGAATDADADDAAASPAVRALHYRPRPDPLPLPTASLASTSSRAAAVAAAAAAAAAAASAVVDGVHAAAGMGERSKSASATLPRPALHGVTSGGATASRNSMHSAAAEAGTTPKAQTRPDDGELADGASRLDAPRDSDMFSPLPSYAPTGVTGGGSSGDLPRPGFARDFAAFDSDDEGEFGDGISGTLTSPSISGVVADTPLTTRRETLLVPRTQPDSVSEPKRSDSLEAREVGGDSSNVASVRFERDSNGGNSGRSSGRVTAPSFHRRDEDVLAAAADLTEASFSRDSLLSSRHPAQRGDSKPFHRPSTGIASQSASDMNRRRLPPLPPRSMSDDAMAAHLRSPHVGSADAAPAVAASASVGSASAGSAGQSSACVERKCSTLSEEPLPPSPLPSEHAGTPSYGAAGRERGLGEGAATGRYSFSIDEPGLRKLVADEVGSLTADLRNDVKNLHSELVVSLARQEALFMRIVDEKDRRIHDLESQVKQSHGSNRKVNHPVPSWMQL